MQSSGSTAAASLDFTGFGTSDFDALLCPAVDISWTLASNARGCGYASEGATAASVTPYGSHVAQPPPRGHRGRFHIIVEGHHVDCLVELVEREGEHERKCRWVLGAVRR